MLAVPYLVGSLEPKSSLLVGVLKSPICIPCSGYNEATAEPTGVAPIASPAIFPRIDEISSPFLRKSRAGPWSRRYDGISFVKTAGASPRPTANRIALHKNGAGRICSPRIIAPVFALSDQLLLVTQTLSYQADRTLRPFARRRARTLRPLAVAIL